MIAAGGLGLGGIATWSRTWRSPRHLATRGWVVAMLDGPSLLTTRMFESLSDAWHGWSRSLALPGVEPRWRQLADLGVVLLAQALPLPRILLRRVGRARRRAPRRAARHPRRHASCLPGAGLAYWLSPLADLPAAGALAAGIVRRHHRWRGRTYLWRRLDQSRSTACCCGTTASAACAKRRPMIDINAPVAAVRCGPSTSKLHERIDEDADASAPRERSGAGRDREQQRDRRSQRSSGDSTHTAPANVSTLRPPRKPANIGQA